MEERKRQASTMIVANTDGRPSSGRKNKEESRPILKGEAQNKPSGSNSFGMSWFDT